MRASTARQVYGHRSTEFEDSVREFAEFVESKASSGVIPSLVLSIVCSLGGIAVGYALLRFVVR